MKQHLSEWARQHPWKARFLITTSSMASAMIAILLGISLHWLGLIPGQVLLGGSAWIGILAYYLYPSNNDRFNPIIKRYFRLGSHLAICFSALLLFMAAGSQFAASNQKEILSYKGYRTVTNNRTATLPPTTLLINHGPTKVGYQTKQHNLKQNLMVAVQLFKMHNEDMPLDFVLFLIVFGGITATSLSVLIAALACNADCTGFQLMAASAMILMQGLLVGAAVLVVMAIKKIAV